MKLLIAENNKKREKIYFIFIDMFFQQLPLYQKGAYNDKPQPIWATLLCSCKYSHVMTSFCGGEGNIYNISVSFYKLRKEKTYFYGIWLFLLIFLRITKHFQYKSNCFIFNWRIHLSFILNKNAHYCKNGRKEFNIDKPTKNLQIWFAHEICSEIFISSRKSE